MLKKISNLIKISKKYPYTSVQGKLLLLEYALLKLAPRFSFPKTSIIGFMKKHYSLSSEEEFRVRYYVSRIGFDELWKGQGRGTAEDVEHFYREHDKDIWRQAWLSRYSYMYKKKILSAMHVVRRGVPKNGRVLDYGCGVGAIGHYISAGGYSVDVLDLPSPMIDFIRSEMSDVFRKILTPEPGALEKEYYDLVVSLDVLEHTLTPLNIVENILRSIKPGGLFFVSFPTETDFSGPHTREAQEERPKVFEYLAKNCEVIVPESVYRKGN